MARAHPIRIELSPDMSELVESVVQSGDFKSPDEVVAAALTQWKVQRLLSNFAPGELQALLQEGLDSGDPIDGDKAFAEIEDELELYIAAKARG
jgi:putative addiction module CopG family antidote